MKNILILARGCLMDGYYEQFETLRKNHPEAKIELIIPYSFNNILIVKEKKEKKEKGVYRSHLIYLKKESALSLYIPLCKYIKQSKPNIIYVDEEPWLLSTAQVLIAAKFYAPKAKIAIFTWENIERNQRFPLNIIERAALKKAELCIAGNKEAERVLRKKGFKKKIISNPQWGINLERFKKKRNETNEKTIGFIGRITASKGIEDLIEAFKELGKEYKLIIIGTGDLEEKIKREIKEKQLEKRVVIKSAVPYFELPKHLNEMGIIILPSRTTKRWKEQLGHILLEAMACEIPVIGSNSGAIPEVIEDAGLIFKEGDVKELVQKIKELENKKRREELIKKAKERVKEYTIEKVSEKTYQALLAC